MYIVAILFKNNTLASGTFDTKELAENFILDKAEKKEIKKANLFDKKTQKREEIF